MTEYVYEGYRDGELIGAEHHKKLWKNHHDYKSIKIVKVDNSGGKWHTCPYSVEIGNDYTLCCCDESREDECRMDI